MGVNATTGWQRDGEIMALSPGAAKILARNGEDVKRTRQSPDGRHRCRLYTAATRVAARAIGLFSG